MRRIPTFLMLSLAWCAALAQGDDLILRVAAKPTDAWVGQRVTLEVDVLGVNGWAQISKFGELQLPGAYIIQSESQGTRLQEIIDVLAYTG